MDRVFLYKYISNISKMFQILKKMYENLKKRLQILNISSIFLMFSLFPKLSEFTKSHFRRKLKFWKVTFEERVNFGESLSKKVAILESRFR